MADCKNYVIWGSAGHARVLADLIALQKGKVVALIDNDPDALSILDAVPLLAGEAGLRSWITGNNPLDYHALVAIGGGRGRDRLQLHNLLHSLGFAAEALVHPSALLSPSAQLGQGSQLLAFSLLAAGSTFGNAGIINHKSSVDHDCLIGDGVHLAPGVTVCGCVRIGDNVFVGAGSTILPRVSIGSNTVIGAGSLVTTDIPAGVVAYGRPAKIIRSND